MTRIHQKEVLIPTKIRQYVSAKLILLFISLTLASCKDGTHLINVIKDIDLNSPVITLKGDKKLVVAHGSTYIDAGATATDFVDGTVTDKITSSVVIVNNNVPTRVPRVDTNKLATYIIVYEVTDSSGNEAKKVTRTVIVKDATPPQIALKGNKKIEIDEGNSYTDAGATATDIIDGNLDAKIVVNITVTVSNNVTTKVSKVDTNEPGTYTINYSVEDAAGNKVLENAVRTVIVKDTTSPQITLNGAPEIRVDQLSSYTDAGASATDKVDGNLNGKIITDVMLTTSNNVTTKVSSVDTNNIGTYTIKYSVKDAAGNKSQEVTRIVNVTAIRAVFVPIRIDVTRTTSEVSLTWNAVSEADYYQIYVSSNPASTKIKLTTSDITSTSFSTTTNLGEESDIYWIKACKNAGNTCSDFSAETHIIPEYIGHSSAMNNFGGYNNAPVAPNADSFAVLNKNGSITSWGKKDSGGVSAPAGTNFVKIYPTAEAFVALDENNSITAWGNKDFGGVSAPTGTNFDKIYSTWGAFAGLKDDGSIVAWGHSSMGGGVSRPVGTKNDFVKIYANSFAFAALDKSGSITVWGKKDSGGVSAPKGTNFVEIYATHQAFAALKQDGLITVWGNNAYGGVSAPTGTGFVKIYSNTFSFAALDQYGSISAWGDTDKGGSGEPSGTGFVQISSNEEAFAALHKDGYIKVWGVDSRGGDNAKVPTGSDFVRIYANAYSFAALKQDGSIRVWGTPGAGGDNGPPTTEKDFVRIYANRNNFAALNKQGSITTWGYYTSGLVSGIVITSAPANTEKDFVEIHSTAASFVALKDNGSIQAWGATENGGVKYGTTPPPGHTAAPDPTVTGYHFN